jgi:hypothetical protein
MEEQAGSPNKYVEYYTALALLTRDDQIRLSVIPK